MGTLELASVQIRSYAKTCDGADMFISRAMIGGGILIGKYVNGWSQAAIPYGGEE